MKVVVDDVSSSDFSIDSESDCTMSIQETHPESSLRNEINSRNEFHDKNVSLFTTRNETIFAGINKENIMNDKHLKQGEEDHIQPVAESSSKQSETTRRVSIIDETNRTKDKVIKKRRKKSTRLRKPLQNDDLLKNYFEFDKVSSTELTTFKIVPSSSSSVGSSSSHEQEATPALDSEPFITKETLYIPSKLSESSEETNTAKYQQELIEKIPTSKYPNVHQQMNSELMNSYSLQQLSNNFDTMNESIFHEDLNQATTSISYPDNFINGNETLHDSDNLNFLRESPTLPENLDLLQQLLMHFTDPSGDPSSNSKNIDQK